MDTCDRGIGDGCGGIAKGSEAAGKIGILGRKSFHRGAAGRARREMLLERDLIGGGNFAVDAGGDAVGGGFAVHTVFGGGASPTLRVNFSRSICRAWVRRALIVAAEHSSILAR